MSSHDLEYKAHLAQLRSALATAEQMRNRAEAERAQALAHLVGIAQEVVPGDVDRLARQGEQIDEWPPDRLGGWLRGQIKARITRLSMLARTDLADQVTELQAKLTERETQILELSDLIRKLQGQERDLKTARRELAALRQENVRLRERLAALEAQVEVQTATSAPAPAEAPGTRAGEADAWQALNAQASRLKQGEGQAAGARSSPEMSRDQAGLPPNPTGMLTYLDDWRGKSYWPQVEAILRAMGEQGVCRPAGLLAVLRDQSRATVYRNLDRAVEWGLVLSDFVSAGLKGGKPSRVVRLSATGQAVYRHLFGRDPVVSLIDRLANPHRSEEQALLALMARDVFQHYGALVDLFPDPISLASGREYRPDLVVVWQETPLYVEVERGPRRGRAARSDKWSIYAEAGGGQFYFVVPGKEAQGKLLNELTLWTREDRQAVQVSICNLSNWTEAHESPWTLTKGMGQRYKA